MMTYPIPYLILILTLFPIFTCASLSPHHAAVLARRQQRQQQQQQQPSTPLALPGPAFTVTSIIGIYDRIIHLPISTSTSTSSHETATAHHVWDGSVALAQYVLAHRERWMTHTGMLIDELT